MEYHKGARTLNSLILSATNPYYGNVTKSLNLFEQVVSAIKFCQFSNPPIVRRDINPKNILVLPDDTICLIDFRICQVQYGTIVTLVDENVGARNTHHPNAKLAMKNPFTSIQTFTQPQKCCDLP
jgi:serine/threonine protein kinase